MGRRLNTDLDRPFRVEIRTTTDLHIPRFAGADIDLDGWRSIAMPPGDPWKEDWKILEAHIHTGSATRWYRICKDYWATARLGAAGWVVARVLQIKASDKPEG
jgi:hypothetical protein